MIKKIYLILILLLILFVNSCDEKPEETTAEQPKEVLNESTEKILNETEAINESAVNETLTNETLLNKTSAVNETNTSDVNKTTEINQTVNLTICIDSDNGLDHYIAGHVDIDEEIYNDKCTEDNKLLEYYCENNAKNSKEINCTFGCKDGYCLMSPLTSGDCTDTDGGKNIYAKGTLTVGGASYNDFCLSALKIREYYCDANARKKFEYFDCPSTHKCDDGACVESNVTIIASCKDTDLGLNYTSKGIVNGTTKDGKYFSYEDMCFSNTTLMEYYCEARTPVNVEYNCMSEDNVTCSGGACG